LTLRVVQLKQWSFVKKIRAQKSQIANDMSGGFTLSKEI